MRARSKNQRNISKLSQQASRRTTPVPEKLKAILDLVNLVPPEIELPDVYELLNQRTDQAIAKFQDWYETRRLEIQDYEVQVGPPRATPEYRAGTAEVMRLLDEFGKEIENQEILDAISAGTAVVSQFLDGLPKSLRDFVWQVGEEQLNQEDSVEVAMYRCSFVRTSREQLRIIANFFTERNPQARMLYYPDLTGFARIMVGEDGTLSVGKDDFAEAVDGVNAKRIRECAICKRIFWAGRINQPCCSTACAHVLRNRRYRARYKDYLVRQHLKENGTTAADTKPPKTEKGKTRKGS